MHIHIYIHICIYILFQEAVATAPEAVQQRAALG